MGNPSTVTVDPSELDDQQVTVDPSELDVAPAASASAALPSTPEARKTQAKLAMPKVQANLDASVAGNERRTAPEPYSPWQTEKDALGVAKGAGRTALGLLKMPFEAARPAEGTGENIAQSIGGTGGLLAKRMIVDPMLSSARASKGAFQAGDIPGGLFHAATTLPIVGPMGEQAFSDASKGDVAGAIGGGLANVAMLRGAPEAAKAEGELKFGGGESAPLGGKVAEQSARDFKAAIPPTKTTPYTPEDYAAARQHMEEHHSGAGGVEEARDSADAAIGKIENKISEYISANPTATIETKPLDYVRGSLSSNPRGEAFVSSGLKELEDFHLDQPKTLAQADAIRRQLNAENKAVLKRNNYDVSTARASDPGFAAREAAAESLRTGIYDRLRGIGIDGVDDLRRTEGSLIKIRNAANAQIFNGEKTVSQPTSNARKLGGALSTAAGGAAGATIGSSAGPVGTAVGGGIGAGLGRAASKLFVPENMTRDALADRSFSKRTGPAPQFPETQRGGLPAVISKPEPPQGAGKYGSVARNEQLGVQAPGGPNQSRGPIPLRASSATPEQLGVSLARRPETTLGTKALGVPRSSRPPIQLRAPSEPVLNPRAQAVIDELLRRKKQ